MEFLLKMHPEESDDMKSWNSLINELLDFSKEERIKVFNSSKNSLSFDVMPINEIIIAFGSAGVFTTIYKIINAYLNHKSKRKIVIETKDNKIMIESHNLPEATELLRLLFGKEVDQNHNDLEVDIKKINFTNEHTGGE